MTQHGADELAGFSVTHVESTLCAQGQRCDERFWSIHQFIIGVPAQMVVAISVEVHEHTIERVIGVLFAFLA